MTAEPRRQMNDAVDASEAAIAALVASLHTLTDHLAQYRRAIDNGEPLIQVLERLDTDRIRAQAVGNLDGFQQARYQLRHAIFRLALSQGASVAELAQVFGYTPDLAARYAKQATA